MSGSSLTVDATTFMTLAAFYGTSTLASTPGSAIGDVLYWNGTAWATTSTSTLGFGTSNVDVLADLSNVDAADVLGNLLYWDGDSWSNIATSSLNVSTTDLIEGTNLFFTDARATSAAAAYISASSAIPSIEGTTLGDLLYWDGSGWATTSTTSLNIEVDTITGVLAVNKGGTGTSTAPQAGEVLVGDGAGNYAFVATSTFGTKTFLGLTDTFASYNTGRLLFSGTDGVYDSSFLSFSTTTRTLTTDTLAVSTTTATSTFAGGVTMAYASSVQQQPPPMHSSRLPVKLQVSSSPQPMVRQPAPSPGSRSPASHLAVTT
jgi:hypothetical protein